MHISRCEFVALLACVCRNMGRPYAAGCVLWSRLPAQARAAGMHGACACFGPGCVHGHARQACTARVRALVQAACTGTRGRHARRVCVLWSRLRARAGAAGMHGACACFGPGCVRSPCGRHAFASRGRRALGINKGVGLCIDLCKQVSFRDNGVRLLKTHRARTVSRLGTGRGGGGDSHTLLFQVSSTHAQRPRKPIRASGSRLWPTAGGSVPGITV